MAGLFPSNSNELYPINPIDPLALISKPHHIKTIDSAMNDDSFVRCSERGHHEVIGGSGECHKDNESAEPKGRALRSMPSIMV